MKPWLIEQQELLSKQILANRLPHAILFSGVTGAGKLELAQWLVQVLLCQELVHQQSQGRDSAIVLPCQKCKNCQLYSSQTYPDHMVVNSDSKSIGVDDIRLVSRALEKTSQLGRYKTVLIPMAEKMTIAAANALLKTLEEPTEKSVIVLLSDDADNLLPTIISRSRLFDIRPPVGDTLLSGLSNPSDPSLSLSFDKKFINLTHLPELTDTQVMQRFIDFQAKLHRYFIDQQGLSYLIKTLVDEPDAPDALRWLEKIIVNMMRAKQSWLTANEIDQDTLHKLEQSLTPDKLWKIHQMVIKSRKQVKVYSQINFRFLVEKLLVDIGELITNQH
mgnify:CR=1 FL=1